MRVPETVLRVADGGEPPAAARGGGAAGVAGGPAHRALPPYPPAAAGFVPDHVPPVRARDHRRHRDSSRRHRQAAVGLAVPTLHSLLEAQMAEEFSDGGISFVHEMTSSFEMLNKCFMFALETYALVLISSQFNSSAFVAL